jgi:PLP dependent protein
MDTIASRLQAVRGRLHQVCEHAGRAAGAVNLVAVSKTFPADAVAQAAAAGQREFGENYIQEAVEKITALSTCRVDGQPLVWHCIGPIQSNKTRLVAEHFDWAHTIDRLKIAERLSEQRPAHLGPLQVCVQLNVAPVANKSGVNAAEALELCRAIMGLPGLKLRGVMSIPDPIADAGAMQALFAQVSAEHARIGAALGSPPGWDTVSMGMSADMDAAVAAGSTLVRVGTAIFGGRT